VFPYSDKDGEVKEGATMKNEEENVYYRGRGKQQEQDIPLEFSKPEGISITPDMFEIEKSLGKGAFGKVFLVTKKDDGKQYAMKVLSKSEIIKNKITRYAITEKNVMSKISHPFIVSLNYAFQTEDLLYLILDYCPGGNLADILDRINNLNEDTARMYA
jgi:serine/threonine protein kinase